MSCIFSEDNLFCGTGQLANYICSECEREMGDKSLSALELVKLNSCRELLITDSFDVNQKSHKELIEYVLENNLEV